MKFVPPGPKIRGQSESSKSSGFIQNIHTHKIFRFMHHFNQYSAYTIRILKKVREYIHTLNFCGFEINICTTLLRILSPLLFNTPSYLMNTNRPNLRYKFPEKLILKENRVRFELLITNCVLLCTKVLCANLGKLGKYLIFNNFRFSI